MLSYTSGLHGYDHDWLSYVRCVGFDETQTSSYQVRCDVQRLSVSFYLMNLYEEVNHEGARLSKTAL